jgi:oxygen-dependent protoporphyrinogen oxidase
LNGFGFLVPQKERRNVAAATWVSTKFPSRVPKELAAIRAFIVGPQATDLMDSSDEAVVDIANNELREIMGIETSPVFSTVYKWPDSMPQYLVGHAQRVRSIRRCAAELKHLHLVGNAYEGVGIPDCVRLAKQVADRISANGR